MAIWLFFPILVCCTKKNLATLTKTRNKFAQAETTSAQTIFFGQKSSVTSAH
jgi:hypothetical protein